MRSTVFIVTTGLNRELFVSSVLGLFRAHGFSFPWFKGPECSQLGVITYLTSFTHAHAVGFTISRILTRVTAPGYVQKCMDNIKASFGFFLRAERDKNSVRVVSKRGNYPRPGWTNRFQQTLKCPGPIRKAMNAPHHCRYVFFILLF